MNINKPWLKNYPKGVSSTINFDEYLSLVDMFDKTCKRFSSNTAFTNFGISLTFNEIYTKSSNLASFLQNELTSWWLFDFFQISLNLFFKIFK